jgi:AraC-like DNA-binding protein
MTAAISAGRLNEREQPHMHVTSSKVVWLPPCPPAPVNHVAPKRGRAETLRATRIHRIRAFVEANLADPSLSAAASAHALGMSVRSLHLALAPTGETFGEFVQRRRLAVCHMLLRRPDNAATIADIAFACGFNSLSSFYRAFRRAYGACPRQAA